MCSWHFLSFSLYLGVYIYFFFFILAMYIVAPFFILIRISFRSVPSRLSIIFLVTHGSNGSTLFQSGRFIFISSKWSNTHFGFPLYLFIYLLCVVVFSSFLLCPNKDGQFQSEMRRPIYINKYSISSLIHYFFFPNFNSSPTFYGHILIGIFIQCVCVCVWSTKFSLLSVIWFINTKPSIGQIQSAHYSAGHFNFHSETW